MKASRRLLWASLVFFIAAIASGQDERAEPAVSTLVVPVVAHVIGIGNVEWRTDVTARNDTGAEVDVAFVMPSAGDAFYFTTLTPGATLDFIDLVRQLFGLAQAIGPLIVRTSGSRSISVNASIYGVTADRLTGSQLVPALLQPPFSTLRMLGGLTVTDRYRTNIGLVNYGEVPATFSLALQRLEGRYLATTRVIVPPGSVRQTSLEELFPLVAEGSFSLLVDSSSRETYSYASVLENETNEPRFVVPAALFYPRF